MQGIEVNLKTCLTVVIILSKWHDNKYALKTSSATDKSIVAHGKDKKFYTTEHKLQKKKSPKKTTCFKYELHHRKDQTPKGYPD